MQPTPLTTALPKLAARIDDERPLISHALLDVIVTEIGDDIVRAEVTTEHSFEILSMPAQHEYLDKVLSREWQKNASFFLSLHTPSDPPPTTANHSQPPQTSPKRTANALTFTERAALQFWMQQADNEAYVATESDNAAAIKATQDLADKAITITAGNIASMRKILGIEKVKPAKPAAQDAHNIDLVALQAQVQQHHLQLDPIAGVNIAEVLSNLRNSLFELENRVKSLEASAD